MAACLNRCKRLTCRVSLIFCDDVVRFKFDVKILYLRKRVKTCIALGFAPVFIFAGVYFGYCRHMNKTLQAAEIVANLSWSQPAFSPFLLPAHD